MGLDAISLCVPCCCHAQLPRPTQQILQAQLGVGKATSRMLAFLMFRASETHMRVQVQQTSQCALHCWTTCRLRRRALSFGWHQALLPQQQLCCAEVAWSLCGDAAVTHFQPLALMTAHKQTSSRHCYRTYALHSDTTTCHSTCHSSGTALTQQPVSITQLSAIQTHRS